MAGYLDQYGAGDERRERIIKRILVTLLTLVVVAGILYFWLRNFREKQAINAFFDDLKSQNYKSAYTRWGCTEATPCRDYSFERFMEDWGPKSPHANVAAMKVKATKSCDASMIQILDFGSGEEVNMLVDRKTRTIGFAPWPVCNPRMAIQ